MHRKKTATYVRPATETNPNASVFSLSHPLGKFTTVIVSRAVTYEGPETYIFGTRKRGKSPTSWAELPGSFKGDLNEVRALHNAGYTVVYPAPTKAKAKAKDQS